MTDISAELKELSTAIKQLVKRAEKLSKAAKKTVKTRGKKKAVAKKAPVAKKYVRKKMSAADTMFGFIKRSRNGLDSNTLTKKTGFDKKKVQNLLHRLKKQGKIHNVKKGVYIIV